MTEPNSLFSNMMITICAKLGTSGLGVAVGVGLGSGVAVGGGVRVGKGVTDGFGKAVGVEFGWLPQAASTNSRIRNQINGLNFMRQCLSLCVFVHYTSWPARKH